MKKTFNWLGFTICCLYCIVDLSLWGLSFYPLFFDRIFIDPDICTELGAFALLFLIIMPFVFSHIWNRTYQFVLPIQTTRAFLINKQQKTLSKYARGLYFVKEIYILTFETFDGVRKTFCVEAKKNPQIFYNLSNETGTLCYKEQGKHIHFVSFTPDSTGQPIS